MKTLATSAMIAGGLVAAALPLGLAPAGATLGPHAARCDRGDSSVVVSVTGFRVRTGTVRVQLYAANPRTFLERGRWLQRIDVPVASSGDMAICVPIETAGRYAVSVRHDANGNGRNDRADGGGFSGNPDLSLLDLVLRRKPSLARVAFPVSQSPARVTVVLNYVRGSSFEPVS